MSKQVGPVIGWYLIRCPNDCEYVESGTYIYSKEHLEEIDPCSNCNSAMEFIPAEDVTFPLFFISCAQDHLEDTNRHSLYDLPRDLFRQIRQTVPIDFHLSIAKAIFEQFLAL